MKIKPVKNTRLAEVDYANLGFGDYFSDHMVTCEYSDGAWGEPSILGALRKPTNMGGARTGLATTCIAGVAHVNGTTRVLFRSAFSESLALPSLFGAV